MFGESSYPANTIINILWATSIVLFVISVVINFIFAIKTPRFQSDEKLKIIRATDASQAVDGLRSLKSLLNEGIISQETYDEKKKKYIELL